MYIYILFKKVIGCCRLLKIVKNQASDITNWPFLLLGARNLLANNSKEALLATGFTAGVNVGIQYSLNEILKLVI